ncbi:hypothetical protein ACHAXR_007279 [Thalassiosira sp. AJA248-18]
MDDSTANEAKVEVDIGDVENQQSQDDVGDQQGSSSKEKPVALTNVGIFAGDDGDDTASVFSFDSYEKHPRIPMRVQNMMQEGNAGDNTDDPNISTAVPFPSVMGASMNYENAVNVCPCSCLFFTLKETIFLIMSALGCGVFLAGLILLCMYLAGSFP